MKKYTRPEAGGIHSGVKICKSSLGMRTSNKTINWERWGEGFIDITGSRRKLSLLDTIDTLE